MRIAADSSTVTCTSYIGRQKCKIPLSNVLVTYPSPKQCWFSLFLRLEGPQHPYNIELADREYRVDYSHIHLKQNGLSVLFLKRSLSATFVTNNIRLHRINNNNHHHHNNDNINNSLSSQVTLCALCCFLTLCIQIVLLHIITVIVFYLSSAIPTLIALFQDLSNHRNTVSLVHAMLASQQIGLPFTLKHLFVTLQVYYGELRSIWKKERVRLRHKWGTCTVMELFYRKFFLEVFHIVGMTLWKQKVRSF